MSLRRILLWILNWWVGGGSTDEEGGEGGEEEEEETEERKEARIASRKAESKLKKNEKNV